MLHTTAPRWNFKMNGLCLAAALSATAWLAGCATSDDTFRPAAQVAAAPSVISGVQEVSLAAPTGKTDDLYDQLYPFYAEPCAVSEINKKPGFGAAINGGFGGHSVLYLNGVCRVTDAGYPTIKICDGEAPGTRGVGLSVNDHFKNTNWVATEGKDFLFYGSLDPNAQVTQAGYRQTQAQAMKMGILDGVKFHERFFDKMPPGMSRREYMYEISVATDYAINFGRDRYCARVPMSRDQMSRVVNYLNQLNDPYRTGQRHFQWDVLSNNCSHMTHNALAAAGIWQPVDVDEPFFMSAFDFPVPKNEFVNLMRRTNDLPLDDLLALYRDEGARAKLLADGRLPMRAGGLAEVAPVIPKNDLYETRSRLIFYDPLGRYQRDFKAILADPRYLDLRTNLTYFAALYQRIAAARKPLDWYLDHSDRIPAPGPAQFALFYQRFYQSIDRESAAIDAKLATLNRGIDHSQPVMLSSSTSSMLPSHTP
ncbi:MAG TPA: hypothetical protein VF920_14050 [Dongiaceae bacterium]